VLKIITNKLKRNKLSKNVKVKQSVKLNRNKSARLKKNAKLKRSKSVKRKKNVKQKKNKNVRLKKKLKRLKKKKNKIKDKVLMATESEQLNPLWVLLMYGVERSLEDSTVVDSSIGRIKKAEMTWDVPQQMVITTNHIWWTALKLAT